MVPSAESGRDPGGPRGSVLSGVGPRTSSQLSLDVTFDVLGPRQRENGAFEVRCIKKETVQSSLSYILG